MTIFCESEFSTGTELIKEIPFLMEYFRLCSIVQVLQRIHVHKLISNRLNVNIISCYKHTEQPVSDMSPMWLRMWPWSLLSLSSCASLALYVKDKDSWCYQFLWRDNVSGFFFLFVLVAKKTLIFNLNDVKLILYNKL